MGKVAYSGKSRLYTLGEKRRRAFDLRMQQLSYSEIGRLLGVPPIRARDYCIQYQMYRYLPFPQRFRLELSVRAIYRLVLGSHAEKIEPDLSKRLGRLIEIAASYTRKELMAEPNVSTQVTREIEAWLKSKDLRFRPEVQRAVRKRKET